MNIRGRYISGIIYGTMALLAFASAPLQAYPDRPVKLVVPYPPGGATDMVGRLLAEQLRKDLGQPVIVENKPGANTAIGAAMVASAPADGYTILLASSASLVLNPLLYRKLSYDPLRDLAPVARLASLPLVMVVNPTVVAARTIGEFVSYAKTRPVSLSYASVGIGNPIHLATELFKTRSGIELLHVPYNGTAPALLALMSGDVQVFFDVISTSLPHIRAGKLRALGVTTRERLKVLPGVPTVAESGYPGYEAAAWYAIAAPKKTPPEIIAQLNAGINKILADRAFRDQLENLGLVVYAPNTLRELADFIASEHVAWQKLIKDKNISLD